MKIIVENKRLNEGPGADYPPYDFDDDFDDEFNAYYDGYIEEDDDPNSAYNRLKANKFTEVNEGYELLDGTKVEVYSDYEEAKDRAEELGLVEAEYGDVYGSDLSYCYWNESGNRNDDEQVIAYYKFENGSPRPLTSEERDSVARKYEIDSFDNPALEDDMGTYFDDIQPELEEDYTFSSDPQDLRKEAMRAYKENDDEFFKSLSDEELVILWKTCLITDENKFGAPYDDEVYDAIADRPNAREIFDRAKGINEDEALVESNGVYDQFTAIVDKYFPNEKKINSEVQALYNRHKGDPAWDEAWRKWIDSDIDTNSSIEESSQADMSPEAKELYNYTKNVYKDGVEITKDCAAPLIAMRKRVKKAMQSYCDEYCTPGTSFKDIFTEDDFQAVARKLTSELEESFADEINRKSNKRPLTEGTYGEEERIQALAAYLDIDTSEVSHLYDNVFETSDGEEYYVVTSAEATVLAEEDIKSIFDDLGINSFTPGFKEWIIKNALQEEWFQDAVEELYLSYVDDLEYEDDDIYGTRLVQELVDVGLLSDDDFVQGKDGEPNYSQLVNSVNLDDLKSEYAEILASDVDDPVEHCANTIGWEWVETAAKENDLYDIDAIVEACIEADGVAHFLARYDGEELDLGNGLYAYRCN